jgi:type IV pilus assembly protein PilX
MSAIRFRRAPQRPRRERGFILVTGLLFLVVMTLLGLALFRSSGLLDRLTANTRDKQRSFEAAQASLEYGYWWLNTPAGGGDGKTCATNTNATVATIHVCTEALSTSLTSIATLDWISKAFAYTLPNMTVVAGGGGMNAAGTDINYQAPPGLYLENLGLSSDGKTTFYQGTAYGYGGDMNTASVVRSTYKRTAKSKDRGAP